MTCERQMHAFLLTRVWSIQALLTIVAIIIHLGQINFKAQGVCLSAYMSVWMSVRFYILDLFFCQVRSVAAMTCH
jgi:hypothetical protein